MKIQEINKSSNFTVSSKSIESPIKYGDFRDKYIDMPYALDICYHTSYRYFADYYRLKASSKEDRKTLNELVLINTSNCLNISLKSVIYLQKKHRIPTKTLSMVSYALQVINITDDVFKSIMNDRASIHEVLGEDEYERIEEKYFSDKEYEGFFPDSVVHACEFLSYLGKTNNASYLEEDAKKDYFLVETITQYPRLRELLYKHSISYSLYNSLLEASQVEYYHCNRIDEAEVLRDSRTIRIDHDYSTGDCVDGDFKYHHDSYLLPIDCKVDELVNIEVFNLKSIRNNLDRSLVRDAKTDTNGYIAIR